MSFSKAALILLSVPFMSIDVGHASERTITRNQMPQAVRETVDRFTQGATVKSYETDIQKGKREYEVETIRDGHSKQRGTVVAYEAQMLKSGEHSEVQIGPDGQKLDHEEWSALSFAANLCTEFDLEWKTSLSTDRATLAKQAVERMTVGGGKLLAEFGLSSASIKGQVVCSRRKLSHVCPASSKGASLAMVDSGPGRHRSCLQPNSGKAVAWNSGIAPFPDFDSSQCCLVRPRLRCRMANRPLARALGRLNALAQAIRRDCRHRPQMDIANCKISGIGVDGRLYIRLS